MAAGKEGKEKFTMPPQHQTHKPQSSGQQFNLPVKAPEPIQEKKDESATHLSILTHSPKIQHRLPTHQPVLPPPVSPEPGSVTPVGGPPTYPPPALPVGVAPPAPPPGTKVLTSQMSVPVPMKPPPIPSRSTLPFRQASLGPPLGQPPPPPPRNK